MKLTEKDVAFLSRLSRLMQNHELWVELKPGPPDYMVLRGNYGEKVTRNFHMTRQGVRWRFQRLLNHVYVEAFETILAVEQALGSDLRAHAVRISKQRHSIRTHAARQAFESANRLCESSHDEHFHQDRTQSTQGAGD